MEKQNSKPTIEDVYKYIHDLNQKHPPFDPKSHIPLSVKHPTLSVKELWKLVSSEK